MTKANRQIVWVLSTVILVGIILFSSGVTEASRTVAQGINDVTLAEINTQDGRVTSVVAAGEYLVASVGQSIVILEKASENNLITVAQTNRLDGEVTDIVAEGDAVYVSTSGGIYAIDITRPDVPIIRWHQAGFFIGLSLEGKLLAVGGYWGEIILYDVGDAFSPKEKGRVGTDIYLEGISLTQSYIYIIGSGEFKVVDVKNPADPSVIWRHKLEGYFTNIVVAGKRAYLVGMGLSIFAIDDPHHPTQIGSYEDDGYFSGGFHLIDDRHALVGGRVGISLLDVQDPAHVKTLNEIDINSPVDAVTPFGDQYALAGSDLHLLNVSLDGGTRLSAVEALSSTLYDRLWAVRDNMLIGSYPVYDNFQDANILYAIDLANPYSPTVKGSVRLPFRVNALASSGSTLFAGASDGLYIMDVGSDFIIRRIGSLPFNDLSDVYYSNGYVYLALGDKGLAVVDVSDPGRPRLIRTVQSVRADLITGANNHLYIFEDNSEGALSLAVLSLSEPANPAVRGRLPLPDTISDFLAVGSIVYGVSSNKLLTVDATDPDDLWIAGAQDIGYSHGEIREFGGRLYISGGVDITVFDIKDNPSSPIKLANFEAGRGVFSLWVKGDLIYAANSGNGLTTMIQVDRYRDTIDEPDTGFSVGNGRVSYQFGSESFPSGVNYSQPIDFEHVSVPVPSLIASPPHLPLGIAFRNNVSMNRRDLHDDEIGPYEMTIDYGNDFGPIDEQSLGLWFYDGGQWIAEPAVKVDLALNQLTVRPRRYGTWALTGRAHQESFSPIIGSSFGSSSPIILGIEITQGVQRLNNSVPLVAGRSTLVRIHAGVIGRRPTDGVVYVLRGSRNGQPLPGSPLRVSNWAVFPNPERGQLRHSFNFNLPSSWLNGDVTLTGHLETWWGGADQGTISANIKFNDVPPLEVILVPIETHDTRINITCPAPNVDPGKYQAGLMSMFPVSQVNVKVRAPLTMEAKDMVEMLHKVTSLKGSDGVPRHVIYYGAVGRLTTDQSQYCLDGIIAGLGWVGRRVSTGIASTSTMLHESGHNMSLRHAPCGDPDGIDPAFPYADGSIGEYGYNALTTRVWRPNWPDLAKDFMSYCGPEWISDYHFRKLYEDQRANGRVAEQAAPQTSLMIRVTRDAESGDYRILPVYQLEAIPSDFPPSGELQVELLDQQGGTVASYPIKMVWAEEKGFRAEAAIVNIPIHGLDAISRIRLVNAGKDLAERSLTEAPGRDSRAEFRFDSREKNLSLTWSDDRPVLIRFREDEGIGWTTYALDSTDGNLHLSAEMMPSRSGHFEVIFADVVGIGSSERLDWPER